MVFGMAEVERCIGGTPRDLLPADVLPVERYCFLRDLRALWHAALSNVRGDGHARAGH